MKKIKVILSFMLIALLTPLFAVSANLNANNTANAVGSSSSTPATFLAQIVDYSSPVGKSDPEYSNSNIKKYGYDPYQTDEDGNHDTENRDLLNYWNLRSGGSTPVVDTIPDNNGYVEQYKVLKTIGDDLANSGYCMIDDYAAEVGTKPVTQSLRISVGEFGDKVLQFMDKDVFNVSIKTTTENINIKFLSPVYTYNYGGTYEDLFYAYVDLPYNMVKSDENGFALDEAGEIINLGYNNMFRLSNQGTLLLEQSSGWTAVELQNATEFIINGTDLETGLGALVLEDALDYFDIVGGHLMLKTLNSGTREVIDSVYGITISKFKLPEGTYTITLGRYSLNNGEVTEIFPGAAVSFNLVKKSSYLKPGQEPFITNAGTYNALSESFSPTATYNKNLSNNYLETMLVYNYNGQFINKPHLKWDATKYSVEITSYNFGILYKYSVRLTKTDTTGGNLLISRMKLNPETNQPSGQTEEKMITYSPAANVSEFPFINIDLSELGTYNIKYKPLVLNDGEYQNLYLEGMPESKTLFVNNFGFSLNYATDRTGTAPFYKQAGERTLKQFFENSISGNLAGFQTAFSTQSSDITPYITAETTGADVITALNGLSKKPVRTNQAPVWFDFVNKSITTTSTVYFRALGETTWSEYTLLKDSLFTKAGTYVVFAKYAYGYSVGIEDITGRLNEQTISEQNFTQVFAFEINNTNPQVNVQTTADREELADIRAESTWFTLGGGQYTNNSVKITVAAPSAFDAEVLYKLTQLEFGTGNAIISSANLMQSVPVDGSMAREFYYDAAGNLVIIFKLAPDVLTANPKGDTPVGSRNHNGHYIISIQFGTTGSNLVFDFYIDTTPIDLVPLASTKSDGTSMAEAGIVPDDVLVVENGFKLDWITKKSGAVVSAEYASTFFSEDPYNEITNKGVRTGAFSMSDNLTKIPVVKNQNAVINGIARGEWTAESNIWLQAQYKIGELSTNFVPYANQTLFTAGIYLFKITDTAGNITNYAIIIDNNLTANVITIEGTLPAADDVDLSIVDDLEPKTHNVIWGTHKAIAVSSSEHNTDIISLISRNSLGTYRNNTNYYTSELEEIEGLGWFVKVPILALAEPATNPASLKNTGNFRNQFTSTDIKTAPGAISALKLEDEETTQGFKHRRKVGNSGFWVLEVKANEGQFQYQVSDIHNNTSNPNTLTLNFDLSKLNLEARNITDSTSNYADGNFLNLANRPINSTSREQVRAGARTYEVGIGIVDPALISESNPHGDRFKINTITYAYSSPTYNSSLYNQPSPTEYIYKLGGYSGNGEGINLLAYDNYFGELENIIPVNILNILNSRTKDGKYEVIRRYTDNFVSPKDIDGVETDSFERTYNFIIDRNQIIDISFSTGAGGYLGDDNVLILQNRNDNNFNLFSTSENNNQPKTISLDTNLLPVFPYITQNKYGANMAALLAEMNNAEKEYNDSLPIYMSALDEYLRTRETYGIGSTEEIEAYEIFEPVETDFMEKSTAYDNAIIYYRLASSLNIGFGLNITSSSEYGAGLAGNITYATGGIDIYNNNSGSVSIETIMENYGKLNIYRKAEDDTKNTVSGKQLGGFYMEGVHLVSLADLIDDSIDVTKTTFVKKNNQTNFSFHINNEGPSAGFYNRNSYAPSGSLEQSSNSNSPLYHQELTNEGDQLDLFTPLGNATKDVVSVKPSANPISFSFDDPASIYFAKINKAKVTVSTNGNAPVLLAETEITSREIMSDDKITGSGRYRHFFSLPATAGNVYTVIVQFEGTDENYDYTYGPEEVSFYSETYTVVIDGENPENNLRRLITNELSSPQQSFLKDYLGITGVNQAQTVNEIVAKFNGNDAVAKTLRGYAFRIDSNFAFEKAATNSYDTYLKGNLGENYPSDKYSPRLDTYKLFYRRVDYSDKSEILDNGLYSTFPYETRLEGHLEFSESDLRYKKLAYGKPLGSEADITNGYYEIIECDEAGNYRGYYVYLIMTAETPSVTFSYYNYITNASQKTATFSNSSSTGVVNAIIAESGIQGTRNFEITNIVTSDRWFKVTITNRITAAAEVMYTDGSKPIETIIANIKTWLNARMPYSDLNGNSYEIEIQSRFTANNIKVIVNFAKAAPITYTQSLSDGNIIITIENYNIAHSLTTYKLEKANSFTSFTTVLKDLQNKDIFPAGAGNSYLLAGGVYKLSQVDNFGRSTIKVVSSEQEGALDFQNTKYYGGSTTESGYYATSDLTFEYNATLYQAQFSVRNILTNETNWTAMPNDFIEYSSTSLSGIRIVKFKENPEVHYIYRVILTSLLGTTLDARTVIYNSLLPDVYAYTKEGTPQNLSTGYLRTNYARLYHDFSEEKFRTELTGIKAYEGRQGLIFDIGLVNSNTVFDEYATTYYLTLRNELGFIRTYTIMIEESTFSIFRVLDSRENVLTPAIKQQDVPNAPGQKYILYFTTDANFRIELNPSNLALSGATTPTDQQADFKAYTITENGKPIRYVKVYIVPVTNTLTGLNPKIENTDLTLSNTQTLNCTISFVSLPNVGYSQWGNYYYAELYYNNKKVAEIGRDSYASNSFKLTESGEYRIIFRDLAGNTHTIGGNPNFFVYLITDAMLLASSSNFPRGGGTGIALPQMIYNGNVTLTVQNADKFSKLEITGKKNGLENISSISSLQLTEPGYYEIRINYTIGTVTKYTDYKFFIINSNIGRLGIDFQFDSNIYISSFIRHSLTNPNDIGDALTSNDIISLFGSLSRISIGSATPGRYEIEMRAVFETEAGSFAYRPNEEYSFSIMIGGRIPVIESNVKWGTSTNNTIIFKYNPIDIYSNNGQVILGVYTIEDDGNKKYSEEVIIFGNEENVTAQLRQITAPGTYYVEIRTLDNSLVLYRNSVTKTQPMSFGSIMLIVIGVILIGVGTVIFIIYRTKMKVR